MEAQRRHIGIAFQMRREIVAEIPLNPRRARSLTPQKQIAMRMTANVTAP